MGKMGRTAVRMVFHRCGSIFELFVIFLSQTLEKSQRRQHNSNANEQPVVACPSQRRIRPFASAPLFKFIWLKLFKFHFFQTFCLTKNTAQVPKWGNNEDDDDDNGAYETSWEDETEKNNDFKMVDTSGTICLWYPPGERQFQTNHTKDSDDRIEQYISEATDCKYGLHLEQALGEFINLKQKSNKMEKNFNVA